MPMKRLVDPFTIFAVEDDRLALGLIEMRLEQLGHRCHTARSGEEALTWLEALAPAEFPAAILLDREMPGMGGLALVRQLKSLPQLRHIPIVMLTGSQAPEQISEGIDAGVFYYLGKPIQPSILASVLAAALRESEQRRRLFSELTHHQAAFQLLRGVELFLRTLEEAEDAAAFLATAYPDPQRSVSGIVELLFNAVEHGNLGIGYAEKTDLIARESWRSEIAHRLTLPAHAEKKVRVVYRLQQEGKETDGHYLQISDEGAGFDHHPYMRIDPARAGHNHGRGIASANLLAFDALRYLPPGNQVIAYTRAASHATARLHW